MRDVLERCLKGCVVGVSLYVAPTCGSVVLVCDVNVAINEVIVCGHALLVHALHRGPLFVIFNVLKPSLIAVLGNEAC